MLRTVSSVARRCQRTLSLNAVPARAIADGTYFFKDHEWATVKGSEVTLGITEHAQEQLGDVVFVALPSVGKSFEDGDIIATVESVKASSDVYVPLAGKVTAVNEDLLDNPGLVNEVPETDGWFVRLELEGDGMSDESTAMTAEEYAAYLAEEED